MDIEDLKPRETKELIIVYSIYIILALIIGIIIYIEPGFVSAGNLKVIVLQSSTRIILTLGLAVVILLGGLDLASGKLMAVASLVSASLVQSANMPVLLMILIIILTVVLAAMFSAAGGVIIAKSRSPIIAVTTGMNLILVGLGSVYYDFTGSKTIDITNTSFTNIGQGSISVFGVYIPNLVIIAGATSAVVWFILVKTQYGENLSAIGINSKTPPPKDVNIEKTIITTFALAGLLYSLAGVLEVSRTGYASSKMHFGYGLDALAACAISGKGAVKGVIIGVFSLQTVTYGLYYINANSDIQYIIKGLIIIISVVIDTREYTYNYRNRIN